MARRFHDLKLPEGYFTHILIDEASQMLECEALMALGLAGPNARVVLAGDHMQMGPKLFSVEDHQRSNHTLLNRLFHYYQGQKCDAAFNSRIIFSENYRSTKEIVEFISTHFYGERNMIKVTGNIPAPVYQRGKLVRESYNRGYVIPFHKPTRHITIKGRANLGKTFTGDEVVLQKERVISITKEIESARVLVCFLEDEDHSKPRHSEDKFVKRMMIPLKKSEPKVRILISKTRRNFIPIWEQIDGQWVIVGLIGWKENCSFPLGKVIKILPVGKSLDDELKILNEEFKVAPSTYNLDRAFLLADEVGTQREDLRKVMTFTVDSKDTRDLDDAISVREIGDQYELGIHIADVASFVSPGSKLDKDAKQKGATYYCGNRKPIYMFPENLSTEHFSLLPNEDRKVVSLMFKVSKQTNEIIGKHKFQLSVINSNEQLSYDKAGEWITERYGVRPNFSDIKDCVTMAYCFAKSQRKIRLNKDWAYAQPDAKRFPGNRKAQLMIEELSVLFNALVSETLIGSEQTQYCTPLRCQAKPMWKNIQAAARSNDTDNMVDLVAADDIHPLLQPVVNKFRRCCSKTYMICSSSSPKENIGHYSLNVNSYTQASSPIRRYMDIVLQRLLHSVISNENVYYTPTEITTLCSQFEDKIRVAKEYEIKAEEISYAVSRAKQSASMNIFTEFLPIMYKDLKLEDQPFYDEKNQLGVNIVYYFFEFNSKNQRKFVDPQDEKKKQVILYCGPSNKSVDVVAGKLLCVFDKISSTFSCYDNLCCVMSFTQSTY
uniref:RNB domain-containing protein n=1 Tax=Mastacembelus armatus TaxID=205130 RepID=A0A7N9AK10_9TELE